jgi:hypothetical protein
MPVRVRNRSRAELIESALGICKTARSRSNGLTHLRPRRHAPTVGVPEEKALRVSVWFAQPHAPERVEAAVVGTARVLQRVNLERRGHLDENIPAVGRDVQVIGRSAGAHASGSRKDDGRGGLAVCTAPSSSWAFGPAPPVDRSPDRRVSEIDDVRRHLFGHDLRHRPHADGQYIATARSTALTSPRTRRAAAGGQVAEGED